MIGLRPDHPAATRRGARAGAGTALGLIVAAGCCLALPAALAAVAGLSAAALLGGGAGLLAVAGVVTLWRLPRRASQGSRPRDRARGDRRSPAVPPERLILDAMVEAEH